MNKPPMEAVNALVGAGYNPLTAMILASRNIHDPRQAREYLGTDAQMPDPFSMTDMDKAAARVRLALERGEKIAVFGDYDVDGITATCLLTDFLRNQGANCVPYIPGRLEEGYGLNPIALKQLHADGVKLVVTVDCGITAMEEALLCKQLGMDLVITDHHECKDRLPDAVAVVDPHRPDGGYPHKNLSGVGVAFKLAAALCGSQETVLKHYADMVCLGTVADVMPLQGENRIFVTRGLEALRNTQRPGLAALMHESGCDTRQLTASSVGYTLAPRINAAGRMGKIEMAVELFLTRQPDRGAELASGLCSLNRQRQSVESEIYEQAISMLPEGQLPDAIVLADEFWHQGVVGIVASRIAEEFCCPTFLICLDGDHGKASSRSYAGFNLFASLRELSPLLESYGGHELAAGFTIARQQIPAFRESICRLAREYYSQDALRTQLDADCVIPPELFTMPNVNALSSLEPCGNGCPRPLLVMEHLQVERVSMVSNGKHMRLRLRSGQYGFNAIYFSVDTDTTTVNQGDWVDVAFTAQINEFRGERSVQMNITDIRPACKAACSVEIGEYRALCRGQIDAAQAAAILPDRAVLGTIWRYLSSAGSQELHETPACLCRKIVRWSGMPLELGKLLTCLDIFADVGLLEVQRLRKYMVIRIIPRQDKADINTSRTMQRLQQAIE